MQIMQTTLNVGVEESFTFLVISDIHLSEADESETECPWRTWRPTFWPAGITRSDINNGKRRYYLYSKH